MTDSNLTKKAIAEVLMELCEHKRFDKLKIADLTSACGLNRQTFYYHFNDIYALLAWAYEDQSLKFLREGVTLDNWDRRVLQMLDKMEEKKAFYHNTVSADQKVLSDCFFEVTNQLFLELFHRIDPDGKVSVQDREFYARFFTYGCTGVLINWIRGGLREPADVVEKQLVRLAKDTEFFAGKLDHF
ncbi:TetR/AcrR family transcriptional regulator [Listeria costaricensis]|uniref:TetR/AcrR family transcriptional regulator n=1 Tax=Listeria costaricensis TaxID=2026604 RepID=UPI000C0700FE|nr:TetR/AcrR family transcriptional regulator [Listeria costaricensis]